MERLRQAVAFGPGWLPSELRRTIVEGGKVNGALGAFVRKVAEHAFSVNDEDITELHRAHYTDDQIFEATVASALGAGLFRLECVLTVFRAMQSAANNDDFLAEQRSLKVTA
jgi:alkylhydroperoxidase family enzyme